jgi:carboxypeptidase PM20D1
VLSRAITRLEEQPFPARLDGVARTTLEYAAPEMAFGLRLVMANLWLTSPLVRRIMEGQPSAAAQLRTTTAVTMAEGSPKPNVLPQRARAVANFRLLPGETTAGVLEHVRRAVDDARIKVRMLAGSEAPPISDPESAAAKTLQFAIRRVYPDVVYAPVLSTGGTDARHYARLTPNVFRFTPIRATEETFKQMHGVDEQIKVAHFERAVRFYAQLMRGLQR